MKKIKSVPLSEIKVDREYLLFNDKDLTLKSATGQEIIDLVKKMYNYVGWGLNRISLGYKKRYINLESFLKDAEEENNEAEFYLAIFKK